MRLTGDSRRDFEKAVAENIEMKDQIAVCREQIHDLRRTLDAVRKAKKNRRRHMRNSLPKRKLSSKSSGTAWHMNWH